MDERDIKQIELKIGYEFSDKLLLESAFTHSSFTNEQHGKSVSYDRLEFLGDSILGFAIAEELYFKLDKTEGEMTKLRSKIVSKKPLADAVDELGVFRFMRIGNGAKNDVVKSEKAKSDLFESLVAAIYIDCGKDLNEPRAFIKRHLKSGIDTADYKSELQNLTQKQYHKQVVKYETVGIDDEKRFTVEVFICDRSYGTGTGLSKKEAEQNAARIALTALQ